jgi:hypothetical protein
MDQLSWYKKAERSIRRPVTLRIASINLSLHNLAHCLADRTTLLALGMLAFSPVSLSAESLDDKSKGDTQLEGSQPDDSRTSAEIGSKDPETLRFEAELIQYKLRENVIASFVYTFQLASPEGRVKLWQSLERDKAEAAALKNQQAAKLLEKIIDPPGKYDAETLRYKEAVKNLELPAGMVEELVEMFHANEAPFRNTLWQRVKESPLNKN